MTDVIDLGSFRRRRDAERGRRLSVDSVRGRISAGPTTGADDRLARIRVSLEKINRLMAELRALAERDRRLNEL